MNPDSGFSAPARERGANRAFGGRLVAVAALLLVVGCRTYEPRPLDIEAALDAFDRRVADLLAPNPEASTTRPSAVLAGDGIDLVEAERIALVFNADLRVARSDVRVREAVAAHAGTWDDPVLGVDFERVVSNAGGLSPTVLRPTLGWTLPISGRLGALTDAADAEVRLALVRVADLEWDVRHRVRRAWIEWTAAVRRTELSRDYAMLLEELVRTASIQENAGSMTRIDARLFRLELAMMRADLAARHADEQDAERRLRGLMGLPPTREPRLVPGMAGVPKSEASDARSRNNTGLAVMSAEYDVAEKQLAVEIRKQYPDLGVAPGFGTDRGERRVLFDVSIPIPLLNANAAGIAEAEARRDALFVRFEAAVEAVEAEIAAARGQATAALRRREILERDVLPLSQEQVDDTRRVMALGVVDPMLVWNAVKSRHEAALRLVDAASAEATAFVDVRRLIGPAPRNGDAQAEPTNPGERLP